MPSCGSGPKNIHDSITDATAAADAAVAKLNPILLDGDAAGQSAATPTVQNDDLRAQIEKLLFALVSQANP